MTHESKDVKKMALEAGFSVSGNADVDEVEYKTEGTLTEKIFIRLILSATMIMLLYTFYLLILSIYITNFSPRVSFELDKSMSGLDVGQYDFKFNCDLFECSYIFIDPYDREATFTPRYQNGLTPVDVDYKMNGNVDYDGVTAIASVRFVPEYL